MCKITCLVHSLYVGLLLRTLWRVFKMKPCLDARRVTEFTHHFKFASKTTPLRRFNIQTEQKQHTPFSYTDTFHKNIEFRIATDQKQIKNMLSLRYKIAKKLKCCIFGWWKQNRTTVPLYYIISKHYI